MSIRVRFHPEFPNDVRRFTTRYARISPGLAKRFRDEVDAAIDAIKNSPAQAGHFLNLGSKVVKELRRRNLRAFLRNQRNRNEVSSSAFRDVPFPFCFGTLLPLLPPVKVAKGQKQRAETPNRDL